jgi:hypothetical protein
MIVIPITMMDSSNMLRKTIVFSSLPPWRVRGKDIPGRGMVNRKKEGEHVSILSLQPSCIGF